MNSPLPASRGILFAALLLIPLSAGCAYSAAPPSDDSSQMDVAKASAPSKAGAPTMHLPDSYLELYKEVLAKDRAKPRQDFKTAAALSNVALRIWERTHDDTYRKEALDDFNRALSDPSFNLADFHILHHFGELAYRMKKENLLSAEQHQKLVEIAKAQLTGYLKSPDDARQPIGSPLFNIRMGEIEGYAGLLKFLDGEPFDQQQAASTRLNSYFDLLCEFGNTDEDAQNYDSLGMAFAIDLSRLLGRERDFKAPGFRRYFENVRDIVTPSGLVPEYGDSYFSYDNIPMDRIYLMEYAARLYNDPTYLNTVKKMMNRPQQELPAPDQWIRSLALIDMADSSLTLQPIPGLPTQVLIRNAPDGTNTVAPVPDKLILRTGREPGASMVMMDLYASGSHAAKDKGPSIGYYETGQVPLFHNMGRRGTRSAIDGNICWARPAEERFPGLWNHPGEWFTMTIPVNIISTNKAGQFQLSAMVLRNFPENLNNRGCADLSFDNLRLEGPSGTLLVDSFDTADGWSRNLNQFTAPVASPDKTQGSASQSVAWNKVKTTIIGRTFPKPLPAPFTREQFTHLKLDVKYEGTRPYILVRGFGDEVEMGAQVLRPKLEAATAEQRGEDAVGRVSYQHYIQNDTKLTRQIVLTADGYLVIRDVLTPGPSMDGWNAGQLWQLYTLAAHGNHWFCSDDDGTFPNVSKDPGANPTRRMLVRFAADGGTAALCDRAIQDYTCPNPKGRSPTSFFTTYSQRKVQSGHPEVFSMVVVPSDPRLMTPEELARNVSITQSSDGSTDAIISMASRRVVIHLAENTWSVKR